MTNVTLITEKNVKNIANIFDSIKISLDGSTAEKHNFYRGHGNYERTIKAIELLDKLDVNISLAMVVTKNNCPDIVTMAKKWGERLTFQPLFPIGNAKKKKIYICLAKNILKY